MINFSNQYRKIAERHKNISKGPPISVVRNISKWWELQLFCRRFCPSLYPTSFLGKEFSWRHPRFHQTGWHRKMVNGLPDRNLLDHPSTCRELIQLPSAILIPQGPRYNSKLLAKATNCYYNTDLVCIGIIGRCPWCFFQNSWLVVKQF
jgi:hypothetical protein